MTKWSSSIKSVQFLCVCVESAQVAVAFHDMFGFGASNSDVINGFIPSRPYMPVGYGQLGCSGFIVSDKDGNFVTKKSAAYLQHGEAAFDHVESILGDLVDLDKMDKTEQSKKPTTSSTMITTGTEMKAPPSVGVDAMDDEHQICTDSFNRSMKDPTLDNLQELHDILKAHFDHEEELIAKYSSSSGKSNFSSLTSHQMDHQRILEIARAEISRVAVAGGSSSSSNGGTCSLQQGGRE